MKPFETCPLLSRVACIHVPLNFVFIIMYSSVIWMFGELEGMQFSEVNKAMVFIKNLHLQPAAIHSEGVLPAGNAVPPAPGNSCIYSCSAFCRSAPCRECGAPSTFVQLIVVLFVLPWILFQWKLFVTDLPFIEPLFFPLTLSLKVLILLIGTVTCSQLALSQVSALYTNSKFLNLLLSKRTWVRLFLMEHGCIGVIFKNMYFGQLCM